MTNIIQRDATAIVRVRPVRPADRSTIEALHRALHAYEIPLRPTRRTVDALPNDYVDELMGRRRKRYGGVLLAEEAGSPVGFIAYEFGEEHLEMDSAEVGITDLLVIETHRGRGVGRRLVQAVEAIAEDRGAKRVTVMAIVQNTAAHAAYAALGYAPAHLVREKRLDSTED